MKALLMLMTVSLGFLTAGAGHAQAPASAPAGSTAQCKDGSWYSGPTRKGACRGHKGIQEWYGATGAAGAANMPHEATTPEKSRRVSKKEAAGETTPRTAAAPAGSTALCKDGSYFSGETKRGACRGHKGIQEWYGTSGAATAAAPTPASAMPTRAAPAAPPAAAAPATTAGHAAPPAASAGTRAAAPGGGAGQVWVNSESMVYHCPGDRYYGKTKHGEYMSEANAKAKGDHAARGKSCSP